jgi:hypothetical protein
VRQSETTPDDPAVPEQFLDLVRVCIRPNIEIFWATTQKKVPYAPSNQVCRVFVFVEAVENLEGFRINVPARNAVVSARNDGRGHGK